jgi:hypothetical protein
LPLYHTLSVTMSRIPGGEDGSHRHRHVHGVCRHFHLISPLPLVSFFKPRSSSLCPSIFISALAYSLRPSILLSLPLCL